MLTDAAHPRAPDHEDPHQPAADGERLGMEAARVILNDPSADRAWEGEAGKVGGRVGFALFDRSLPRSGKPSDGKWWAAESLGPVGGRGGDEGQRARVWGVKPERRRR